MTGGRQRLVELGQRLFITEVSQAADIIGQLLVQLGQTLPLTRDVILHPPPLGVQGLRQERKVGRWHGGGGRVRCQDVGLGRDSSRGQRRFPACGL